MPFLQTETINTFKHRLDTFWSDQEGLYDYKAGGRFSKISKSNLGRQNLGNPKSLT